MGQEQYLELLNIEINKGDVIDVSSDMASLFFFYKKRGIQFDANELLDSLEDKVGSEGTVMIRSFNWDFCHNTPFDIKSTKSQVGDLGNVCLKRSDYRRTQHPIYSWMVKGKYKDVLCEMDNITSFGEHTPWDFFEKKKAKMITLGNTRVMGLTCLHHIEQELQMEYRYEKDFRALYSGYDGKTDERTYSMYVRKLDRQVIFNEERAKRRLLESKVMKENILEEYLRLASLDYSKAYSVIRADLEKNDIRDWVILKPLEEE